MNKSIKNSDNGATLAEKCCRSCGCISRNSKYNTCTLCGSSLRHITTKDNTCCGYSWHQHELFCGKCGKKLNTFPTLHT